MTITSKTSQTGRQQSAQRRTPAPPTTTLLGMPAFPRNAKAALRDEQLRGNLRHATRTIRAKRVERVTEVPEWQDLRLAAEAIMLGHGEGAAGCQQAGRRYYGLFFNASMINRSTSSRERTSACEA